MNLRPASEFLEPDTRSGSRTIDLKTTSNTQRPNDRQLAFYRSIADRHDRNYMPQRTSYRPVDYVITILMVLAVSVVGALVVASLVYDDKLEQLKHPVP